MAFVLKPDVPVAKGLGRLINKQLGVAADALTRFGPDAEAIHKARTRVKKVRAVLRLFQEKLGGHYRSSNRRLRNVGHLLSELRDAEAMIETLHGLQGRYPRVLSRSRIDAVAAALRSRKERRLASANAHVSRAIRELQWVRRRAPDHVRAIGGKSGLIKGVVKGYRRGREAMRHLSLSSDDHAFHTWRRRVKDHWYQVRLFEGLDGRARARAQRLEKLETLLGDEHNLVVLRLALLEGRDGGSDPRTIALILGCITKHQARLRRHAIQIGGRLFENRAKIIGRSVEAWSSRA
jgi:CHAD domain-containing protein